MNPSTAAALRARRRSRMVLLHRSYGRRRPAPPASVETLRAQARRLHTA